MTTQNSSYPDMPFEASGDLSGKQYHIMAKNAVARQVFASDSKDDFIVGVPAEQTCCVGSCCYRACWWYCEGHSWRRDSCR